MYFTFFTEAKPYQLTFEDLLKNPFISLTDIPKIPQKKVTLEITEEYGASYFSKNNCIGYENMLPPTFTDITENHYRSFQIPKKSNPHKMRQIDAPDDELKMLQTTYKHYIENILHVLPHKAAHAYVAERSTVTSMKKHQENNSKWFLQMDLKDFFNSIDGNFLKKMLLQVYPFKFIPEETLNEIIKISLFNGVLPQGSVLSPTLTNLLMVPIDHEITEKLHNYKKHHFVYTRYADDITISCKEKFNPGEIERVIRSIFKKWKVPFRINNDKTRFGSSAGRNYHVGLIINKDNKISVGHEKNNKFKAMIFNFCTTGEEWDLHNVYKMMGIISYYKSIEPEFIKKTIDKYNRKFNIDIMQKAKQMIS